MGPLYVQRGVASHGMEIKAGLWAPPAQQYWYRRLGLLQPHVAQRKLDTTLSLHQASPTL